MSTKLDRIAEIAKERPKESFTSLMHLVNKEMLMECHKQMKCNKASGVDKVTKSEYENKLEENIENLLERMKTFKYRPKPVRRVYMRSRMREIRTYGSVRMRGRRLPNLLYG